MVCMNANALLDWEARGQAKSMVLQVEHTGDVVLACLEALEHSFSKWPHLKLKGTQ